MAGAEDAGRVNGKEHPAAAPALPSARRYPHLQHFAAGGISYDNGKSLAGYRIDFGIALGLATGRSMRLEIPRGMPADKLAQLLEDTARAMRAAVKECDELGGTDGGISPPAEGAPLTAETIARGPCPRCSTRDAERLARCRVPACPIAAARAALPIAAPSVLAVGQAFQPANDPSTVTVTPPDGEAKDKPQG